MKIAIYTGTFKENQDGATKTLYRWTDFLLTQGHQVGVWAFSVTPQKKSGLQIFTLPSVPLPMYKDYRIAFPTLSLRNQLRRFRPDAIHVTVPDLVGKELLRLARDMKIPAVTSFHTDFPSYLESYKLGALEDLSWKYLGWFYNQSLAVYAPTDEMKFKLTLNGVENVRLWRRGISPDEFSPHFRDLGIRGQWDAEGKIVILFSGRFVWYKDLQTFVEVYRLFNRRAPGKARFVLAGDGPVRRELEEMMPDARFTGYLKGEDLSRVYASSDMLLFPSTTETFGNVVQEAVASGIPAVVSNVGGCQEIVNRSGAGLVAQAKDAESFFNSCRCLMDNPRLARAMKQHGLLYAREQSWDRINLQLADDFEAIIAQHKAPAGANAAALRPARRLMMRLGFND